MDIKGKQILVVDDDLELCQVIVDTLNDQGYRATFVQSTEEAMKRIAARPPDLVLLDLEVPSAGGFVVCQKIHENPATKDLPVVFLSVRDSSIDKKTALSLGADLYITKPFRRSVLLKEVETLLSRKADQDDVIGPSASHLQTSAGFGENNPPSPQSPAPSPGVRSLDLTATKSVRYYWNTVRSKLETNAQKLWSLSIGHKKIAFTVTILAAAGLIGVSISAVRWVRLGRALQSKHADANGEIAVNVIAAALAPFQDLLSTVGTVKGGAEVELRFQTEGNLKSLNFHDGDAVHVGQVIAQLDPTQATIKLDRAKQEYYRYEKLYALGGVSKDRLEEAKIQLDFAQSELSKTVLRASNDGIFGGKDVEVGEFVTPTKKIGTLVSINVMLVSIGIIEKEIDKVSPGQKVIVTVETYPNVEFKGKVETISPFSEGGAKTFDVHARVPNEGKLLLPGMFARTKIVVYEKDSVISVPNDAVEKTANGYQVYVVTPENKAEVRPVEISYVSLVNSVISSGLQPGEKVIVQKPQDLKAGALVKIAEVEKPIGEGAAMDMVGEAKN